jgi:hypothetical protein
MFYQLIRLILFSIVWSMVIGTCSSMVLAESSCKAFTSEMQSSLDRL